MQTLILKSPAKINLFLHVFQKRDDGYHDLKTHFQFLDYHDVLYFDANKSGQLTSNIDSPTLPWQHNLIYKAAQSLQKTLKTSLGAHIRWQKNLPMGGGIGGGSSNAATTLLALNYLWQGKLSLTDLMQIGRGLGADVPIFLYGHAALAEGIGDILTPYPAPEHYCVLVVPPVHCDTRVLFSHPELTKRDQSLTMNTVLDGSVNDFEPVVRKLFPPVDEAIRWLSRFSPNARLTGSGAASFALFEDEASARHAIDKAPAHFELRLCKTSNVSVLVSQMQALGVQFVEWGVAKR